jgi:hypothetical protein
MEFPKNCNKFKYFLDVKDFDIWLKFQHLKDLKGMIFDLKI